MLHTRGCLVFRRKVVEQQRLPSFVRGRAYSEPPPADIFTTVFTAFTAEI
jgi:hypothetical protein